MESTNLGIVPWSSLKTTGLHWHHGICLGTQWSWSERLILVRKCFGILLLES